MRACNVKTLCEAMSGELVAGDGVTMVDGGISIDTRTIPAGSLFVALAGENFDAHDFLAKAVTGGAAALVVSRVPDDFDAGSCAVIKVGDTLHGLQRLARWYRDELDIVVIGITGSNGKTTTKDFTRSVLEQRYQVHATSGNLNNHIGVPLTVLSAGEDDDVMIVEMGMNHSGEIAPLAEIARPHVGIITNVGTAHIEHLGSREAIAEEKGTLAKVLPEVGTLLVTAGCDFVEYFRERTQARTVPVGNGRGVVRAEGLKPTAEGSVFDLVIDGAEKARVNLPLPGRHMVNNALLAAGAGWVLGLTPDQLACGLEGAEFTSGRLRRFEVDGICVFDDTYNSSPDSVRAAIETLADLPLENGNKHTIVLGMMAELGAHGPEAHRLAGVRAAECGLRVVSVGPEAALIAEGAREAGAGEARHFDDYDEAAAWLREELHDGDAVLFKGSRMAAMEKVMKKVFPEN